MRLISAYLNNVALTLRSFFFTCFAFSRNMFSHISRAIVHIHRIALCHTLVLLACNMLICWLHYKMLLAHMTLNRMLCCMSTSSYMTSGCMKCGTFWFFISCVSVIHFKVATLTYKGLSTQQPAYLYNLISYHQPGRLLCSSSQSLLHVPRIKTDFGHRAFSSAAPQIWNHIPTAFRGSQSLDSFKRHLKTHYFASP